jgi:hypothetical protein
MIASLPQDSVFMVHIDAKSDLQAFTQLIDDPRVYFIPDRTDVMWGSIGVVEAQMKMIREALRRHREEPVDYLISLSGLDYPLWSNARIERFFAEQKGRELIVTLPMEGQGAAARLYREHRPFNYKSWQYGTLQSKFRVALRHIVYALGFRKPLRFRAEGREYVLNKGSMWWAITPALAQLALDYWDHHPQYVHYFHDGFAPDETFIPTLTAHSEFAAKAIRMEGPFKNLESITPLTFGDHHNFTPRDIERLNSLFDEMPTPKCIITTEKDAARLVSTNGMSDDVRRHLYQQPVCISFLLDQQTAFDQTIIGYVTKNSRRKPQTKRAGSKPAKPRQESSAKPRQETSAKPQTISFR